MIEYTILELERQARALRDELTRQATCEHAWTFLTTFGLLAIQEYCPLCAKSRLVYLIRSDP